MTGGKYLRVEPALLPQSAVVGSKGAWFIRPVRPYRDGEVEGLVEEYGPYSTKEDALDDFRGLQRSDRLLRK